MKWRNSILVFLFLFSGFSALVYEIVWSRMLVIVLGNTTVAAAAILAAYMAGMALGSYVWGRYVDAKVHKALLVFGLLECATALAALAVFYLSRHLAPLDTWMFSRMPASPAVRLAARFVFCFLLFSVPTSLMGGTFAVLGKYLIHRQAVFGRTAGVLYGINTLGGFIGVVLTGFFLVQHLGHTKTLFLAVSVNLAVGATALAIGWLQQVAVDLPAGVFSEKVQASAQAFPGRIVLLVLGISGFCAMAYELLWTRLFLLIIDNSVYSFAMVLAFFLLGIMLGGFAAAWVPSGNKGRSRITVFAIVQIGIGVSAFLLPFFIAYRPKPALESYLHFLVFTLPKGLLIPTLLMGMTLPLGAAIYFGQRKQVGTSLGSALAANTLGGVLGVIGGAFFLIPVWGFRTSLMVLPALNLFSGALAYLAGRPRKRRALIMLLAVLIFAGCGYRLMPPNFFAKKYAALEPGSRLLHYSETLASNTAVFERPDQSRSLYLNGIAEVDTSPASLKTFRLMGALPGLLHPDPQNALVITFGAGITAAALAPFVDRIDCVDLEPGVKAAAEFFKTYNHEIYLQPYFQLQVDDARHFVRTTRAEYDLIVSDATHPRVYDSWVLFTREFYRDIRARLEPGGIFLQWVPFHGLAPEQYRSIVKTFSHTFPHTSIWSIGDAYSILLALPREPVIDFQALVRRIAGNEAAMANLKPVGLANPFELLSCFVMAGEKVQELTADRSYVLTDDSPAHLYFPFRATFEDQYATWPQANYETIREHKESVVPFVTSISDSEDVNARILDRLRYFEYRKWHVR